MKFKDKYEISPEFESLFSFKTKEEELEHEAKMIMFRFFSELENFAGQHPIKKKELAKAIQTSASYITQLYQGDKLVNLPTLAKIQDAYNLTFEIKAKRNSENYNVFVKEMYSKMNPQEQRIDEKNYKLFISKKPDYNNNYYDIHPNKIIVKSLKGA